MEGIVLRSLDFSESSNIIYLYTIEGIKSVLIKGAKRKDSGKLGFLLTFNFVNIRATKSNLPVFMNGDITKEYSNIQNDFYNNMYFSIIKEILLNLIVDDHEIVYPFLIKCLNKEKDYDIISLIFSLKMLYILGYSPNFKSEGNYFLINSAKFSDTIDDSYIKFNRRIMDIIYYLYSINIDSNEVICIEKSDFILILKFINEYYMYHINYKIQSIDIILKTIDK